MSTTRLIENRIKSVKATAKITKAMELVAASRMKRSQQNAQRIIPYANGLSEIAQQIGAGSLYSSNVLLKEKEKIETIGIVLFAPNKGFCGSLISNLLLKTASFIDQMIKKYNPKNEESSSNLERDIQDRLQEGVDDFKARKIEFKIITVNREAKKIVLRLGYDELAHFSGIEDDPEISRIFPIYEIIVDSFTDNIFDEVYMIYPSFKSTVHQVPVIQRILPISPENLTKEEVSKEVAEDETGVKNSEFLFEPNRKSILNHIIPHYLRIQLFDAYLELIASEYSARMVAMRKATENAEEMMEDLTLVFNKQRQTAITNEILEVSSGSRFS
ncbi:MAG: F0F1 ATP synthase subunit gamma [Candidatus Dojkabacteria bacterium]|nr:F0F1 ATP synthase subunit gamma [Candidatus Dojkabacteria bacterium]